MHIGKYNTVMEFKLTIIPQERNPGIIVSHLPKASTSFLATVKHGILKITVTEKKKKITNTIFHSTSD